MQTGHTNCWRAYKALVWPNARKFKAFRQPHVPSSPVPRNSTGPKRIGSGRLPIFFDAAEGSTGLRCTNFAEERGDRAQARACCRRWKIGKRSRGHARHLAGTYVGPLSRSQRPSRQAAAGRPSYLRHIGGLPAHGILRGGLCRLSIHPRWRTGGILQLGSHGMPLPARPTELDQG